MPDDFEFVDDEFEFVSDDEFEFEGEEESVAGLTVASAPLSTDWVDFSTVEYTAETLSDINDCITEVESKLGRGTLSTSTVPQVDVIKRWLVHARQALSEIRQFTWRRRYVTATLTSGSYRYSLPPDYSGGRVSLRDKTNDSKIPITSPHQYDVLFPDPSEGTGGQISVACIKNLELWVSPPSGNDVVELEYEHTGGGVLEELLNEAGDQILDDDTFQTIFIDNSGEFDFTWMPEIERFRCCDFAISKAFAALHEFKGASYYYNKWKYSTEKAIRSDGKKRLTTSGYSARSVFQA